MPRPIPKLLLRVAQGKARLLIRRAEDAQRQRDWAEAERRWRRVIDLAPQDAGAWVQLGNMLNELGRHAEAIDAFRHAGQLDPGLAHAPAGIAGVHERAGRWDDAGKAWIEAVELLSRNPSRGDKTGEELAHAFAHAAMAARNGSTSATASKILERAAARYPLPMSPENMVIRASLLPRGSSAASATFLRDFLALLPSGSREIAMALPTVRDGALFPALVEIAPLLEGGRTDAAFLRIAADLYENGRLWKEAIRIAEWQAEIEPRDSEHVARAFRAASAGGLLADARQFARRHARLTGELILIHELAELYESTQRPDRARLLFRFLSRRWPHSRWHASRYIVTTAATRSLPLSDRLVQQEMAKDRRDQDLELAFCRSAFVAGHYDEARRRLVHYVERHDDHDAAALLGYAIANASGLDDATEHFRDLSARRMQPLSAMLGVAHMAMRKRDLPRALDQWSEIAIVHSGAGNADVERARCAYNMGDVEAAARICRHQLRRHDHDLALAEFYAWLLTTNGRYQEALAAITSVLDQSGPNWNAVDLQIICSGQLDTMDQDWPRIAATMPAAESGKAISRLYHVVRILIAVGRRDLANRTLLEQEIDFRRQPWAVPYLRAAALPMSEPRAQAAERRWRETAGMLRSDLSDRLDGMSDLDVDAVLGRSRGGQPTVHIVNKFEQPRGGSELHALDLAEQIGRFTSTRIWAPEMPHPEFTANHGVSHIDPSSGLFPRGGILVLIGVYFDIARWIRYVRPARIVFLYNTFEAPSLFARVEEAWRHTGVQPELLYCSDLMGHEARLRGRFEPSPTDLELFSPALERRPPSGPFKLGRHSRDVPEKHGREDWKVYQAVSEVGGESVLLGGACMAGAFPPIRGMQLLKARSSGIPDFLRGLDAYFYRTSTWVEPWGRVVIEAMACGLPVLVQSTGGYAQTVKHEVNGLLFDTSEEAVRLVRRLAEEPDLRLRLGQEARRTICDLLGPAELKRMIAFYLLEANEMAR